MADRFRRVYGAGPLHVLALVASFAIAGFAVAGWFERSYDLGAVVLWFATAILAHDLVLLPLYSLLDRIAGGKPGSARGAQAEVSGIAAADRIGVPGAIGGAAYIRIPALLSGLLLLVFFPLILQLGSRTFRAASGLGQGVYLARWLGVTGLLFALSGVAYAVTLRRARARPSRRRSPRSP